MSDETTVAPTTLGGRYRVEELLGRGRISSVYRGVDEQGDRAVALKVLHDHLVEERSVRQRLRRELAAVRRVDHPAIVEVEDLIEDDHTLALVMELVEGETVRSRVERDGAIPWREARLLLDDLLAGIDAAHRAGVLHRDLNASHVLITDDGRARVVGFGMARVDELAAMTMHTRALGALEAMAPERVLGMDYDGRADLYSVGAIAYEMLLGHPPQSGQMGDAFARAQRSEQDADDPFPDHLPPEARYLLKRALVSDMGARFATAAQMRRVLEGVFDEQQWRRWATRNTPQCPSCEAPALQGLPRCLECGHQLNQLVQKPGAGDWKLQVMPASFIKLEGLFLETVADAERMDDEQFQALMELLASHQDTRRFADGAPEFRWPPYTLLSDLNQEEARRIGLRLYQLGIGTHYTDDPTQLVRPSQPKEDWHWGQMLLHMFIIIGLIGVFGHQLGALTAHIMIAIGAYLAGIAIAGLIFRSAKRKIDDELDDDDDSALRALIPTAALTAWDEREESLLLPHRTGPVLMGLSDTDLRQELHEVVLLAATVGGELGEERPPWLNELLEDLFDTAQALDAARVDRRSGEAAEYISQLERVEARLADLDDDEERRELQATRQQWLERLAQLDQASHRVDALTSRMMAMRGTLLDLRWGHLAVDAARDELRVELDLDNLDYLDDLEMERQAHREVQALVSQEVSS